MYPLTAFGPPPPWTRLAAVLLLCPACTGSKDSADTDKTATTRARPDAASKRGADAAAPLVDAGPVDGKPAAKVAVAAAPPDELREAAEQPRAGDAPAPAEEPGHVALQPDVADAGPLAEDGAPAGPIPRRPASLLGACAAACNLALVCTEAVHTECEERCQAALPWEDCERVTLEIAQCFTHAPAPPCEEGAATCTCAAQRETLRSECPDVLQALAPNGAFTDCQQMDTEGEDRADPEPPPGEAPPNVGQDLPVMPTPVPPEDPQCGDLRSACSGRCADLLRDPLHCGRCDHACSAAELCSGGSCVADCQAGLIRCGDACVDPSTTAAHCGVCGSSCARGATCVLGACQCAVGNTACGQSCVNLHSDSSNCGACGLACAPGQTCRNGVCGPIDL